MSIYNTISVTLIGFVKVLTKVKIFQLKYYEHRPRMSEKIRLVSCKFSRINDKLLLILFSRPKYHRALLISFLFPSLPNSHLYGICVHVTSYLTSNYTYLPIRLYDAQCTRTLLENRCTV